MREAYLELVSGRPLEADPELPGCVLLSPAALVIAPAALAPQWAAQVRKHCAPGALRVRVVALLSDPWPPLEELAWGSDIVVVSFEKLSREWSLQAQVRGAAGLGDYEEGGGASVVAPLLRVRWQHLVLDEGHVIGASLKRKLNVQVAGERLLAERRFLMTGTPAPLTPDAVAYLRPLLEFLRHPSAAGAQWGAIERPLLDPSAGADAREAATLELQRVLRSCSVRHRKCDIRGLPGRREVTTLLDFPVKQAEVYVKLCDLVRRTNLTADWYDAHHEESFLYTGSLADSKVDMVTDGLLRDSATFDQYHARRGDAARRRRDAVANLRLACNVACELDVWVTHRYELDDLAAYVRRAKGAAEPREPWDRAATRGARCERCRAFAFGPGLITTPCAHLLCLSCTEEGGREACPLCRKPYAMQPASERRAENLDPQWSVPRELIENQISYTFRFSTPELHEDLAAQLSSVKAEYILGRLRELAPRGEKALVFSSLEDTDALGRVRPLVLDLLDHHLTRAGIPFARLVGRGGSLDSRRKLAQAERAFRDPQGAPVCLLDAHNACGWDLSFVRTVFLMEPLLDAALAEQVVSRGHRIGTAGEVVVETLVMRGSLEEDLLRMTAPGGGGVPARARVAGVEVAPEAGDPPLERLQCAALCRLRVPPLEPERLEALALAQELAAEAEREAGRADAAAPAAAGGRRVRFAEAA